LTRVLEALGGAAGVGASPSQTGAAFSRGHPGRGSIFSGAVDTRSLSPAPLPPQQGKVSAQGGQLSYRSDDGSASDDPFAVRDARREAAAAKLHYLHVARDLGLHVRAEIDLDTTMGAKARQAMRRAAGAGAGAGGDDDDAAWVLRELPQATVPGLAVVRKPTRRCSSVDEVAVPSASAGDGGGTLGGPAPAEARRTAGATRARGSAA